MLELSHGCHSELLWPPEFPPSHWPPLVTCLPLEPVMNSLGLMLCGRGVVWGRLAWASDRSRVWEMTGVAEGPVGS